MWKWIFSVAWCSRVFSCSVCSAEMEPLEKHYYSTSHQRTLPQLIAALLYHVFVHTWPTAFVNTCSESSHKFHCFCGDIFDRLRLFACQFSLIISSYQHWFFQPSGQLPKLPWGQGSKGKALCLICLNDAVVHSWGITGYLPHNFCASYSHTL